MSPFCVIETSLPNHHLPNISLDYLLLHLPTLNDWQLIVYIILVIIL